MSKVFKRLLGLAAVGGAAAAGVIYYLNRSGNNDDDFLDEFDDDFDLDDDVNPAAEREYVPLNTAPQTRKKKRLRQNLPKLPLPKKRPTQQIQNQNRTNYRQRWGDAFRSRLPFCITEA